MAGYQEVLTDPSYAGQIVTMTYPHIGNYGVNDVDVESRKPWVAGFVVRENARRPSNYRSQGDLDSYLKEHGIPGIEGIDTRALVRRVRIHGAMPAIVSSVDLDDESLKAKAAAAPSMEGQDLVRDVTCETAYDWTEGEPKEFATTEPVDGPRYRVAALDCGIKRNILRLLVDAGFTVRVFPATASPEEIRAFQPDGMFLSNGPGDPAAVTYVADTVRELVPELPTFGICLGNQILALACGARTFKLKFGHRGGNQPVKDLATGKVEITSQNHGFRRARRGPREGRPRTHARQPQRQHSRGVPAHEVPGVRRAIPPRGVPGPERLSLPLSAVPRTHREPGRSRVMPVRCVFGAQWGDEGKGKIVDYLAEDADFAVRYQGGANAGHTIYVGETRYALRLTPSGLLQGATGVIANGVVLDPNVLHGEIAMLADSGIDVSGRLKVSDRAHVVLPFHGPMDRALDASRNDDWINNTTGRGISTCVGDKHRYEGLRVADLVSDRVRAKRLRYLLERGNRQLEGIGAEPLDLDAALAECEGWVEWLRPLVCDTATLLQDAAREGKQVLLEGAQAALLDVDFGTYPFVSASSTGANGIASGTGLPCRAIDEVIAVAKAYVTRVGSEAGPFPTRADDADGERMQQVGKEFGTVTGRPRRCGWFDAVAARYVCRLNGVDSLAITKIDVLRGIDPLRICVAYEVDGVRLERFPADLDALQRATPVYRELPGFDEDLSGARSREDLPARARAYVEALEAEVGVPIGLVSVGPERTETVSLGAA